MIKFNCRSSFLRPLLLATAVPVGLLTAGAMFAHAGTVTVTGANGASGTCGHAGGAGGAATATATTPGDPSNDATAQGGVGGAGSNLCRPPPRIPQGGRGRVSHGDRDWRKRRHRRKGFV